MTDMAEGVTRRSALTATGAAVIGGVAGFAVARNSAAAKQPSGPAAANAYGDTPTSAGRVLAPLADVPDGGGVVLDKPAVVITRTGSDVHAFSAVCTHQGCHVDKVSGGTIRCPCHGSRFDASTGAVVRGPAGSPLPRVEITVRNGEVLSA
jgi:Rieske Fe-S protein